MRCANMERGCQWTGTIGTLDNHIATCQFALVPCPNKCEDDKGAGELHLVKIVPCPNKGRGCPLSMEQGKTKQHVRSVCDYTEVACAYESLGCGVRMPRKDIENHQENDDKVHLHLSLQTVCVLKEQHKTLSEGEALVFKLLGYASKKENNEEFKSIPFYTSPGGYKMCIHVDVNGCRDGKGTHVSVYTTLLEGRYDDQLHWPFLGTITYELLNQLADEKHYNRVAGHNADTDAQVGSSMGDTKFLPHSSLSHDPATNTQYLLDDTLYFRVSVTVAHHKQWLVCTDKINMDATRTIKDNKTLKDGEPMVFKMACYNARKAKDDVFFSDPFYTSPEGYKMCITVASNGYRTDHGTHVSVFATVLEGAYNASLSWPFVGTVTLTLLNQLADDNHHILSIECENNDFLIVGKHRYIPQFISHAALPYNSVKNTQYLKNDTLYFRTSVKEKRRKPWLVCTHHT